MLKEIVHEIEIAIDSAYKKMAEEDYLSFVLLIGRADVEGDGKAIEMLVNGFQFDGIGDCISKKGAISKQERLLY